MEWTLMSNYCNQALVSLVLDTFPKIKVTYRVVSIHNISFSLQNCAYCSTICIGFSTVSAQMTSKSTTKTQLQKIVALLYLGLGTTTWYIRDNLDPFKCEKFLPEFLRKEATLLKVSFILSIRSLLLPFLGTSSSGVKDSNVNGYTTGISVKSNADLFYFDYLQEGTELKL